MRHRNPPPAMNNSTADSPKAAGRGPRRVLVIDDDSETRELVAVVLGSSGYEVSGAEGGSSGLSLAVAKPPDVVLLDVQMPGMNGYEVCRILRRGAKTRQIPVVMLTASDDPHLNREAYAAGAQACVPKPFRREGLIAAIEAVLTGTSRETLESSELKGDP